MTDLVRITASEVFLRALLLHSTRGRRRSGLWLAPKRSMPHARRDAQATPVKNEGASPHTDARTDRVEEGSDDVTFCHLAPAKVVGSLG